jgi:MoaA/NifB/PqqE/SkfB family radical SAM enzyme
VTSEPLGTSALYRQLHQVLYEHCRHSFFYLHLEATNACNTSCAMCPRAAMDRPIRMLSQATFVKIMDLVLPSDLLMLSIVGFGEPLLHRRLPWMIRYARERRPDLLIKLTTNGSRLTPRVADELYASGLDLLEISFVGTDAEQYEAMMGRLKYGGTLEAIDYVHRAGYKFLVATFQTELADEAAIRAFWRARDITNVEIKSLHRRGGYLQVASPSRPVELGGYRSRTGRSVIGRSVTDVDAMPPEACHKLFMFLHVNANGNFIPCVQEINDRNVLFHADDVADYKEVVSRMSTVSPRFDICAGCELKDQDHLDYYTRFLLRYFPDVARRLCA